MMRYIIKCVWSKSYSSKAVFLLLVLLLCSCAFPKEMSMPQQAVQQLKPSEGIVVGSILVKCEHPDKPKRLVRILAASAEKCDYTFYTMYTKKRGQLFRYDYKIKVQPEKEKVFVTKLKEGEYQIYRMEPKWYKILDPNVFVHLDVHFSVAPGKTTYIGKFVFNTGKWLYPRSPCSFGVEDAQDKTIEAIKEEYADEVKEVTKDLMTFQR